jgi:signal transduction histidine kinase
MGYLFTVDGIRVNKLYKEGKLKEEFINKSALIKINRLVKEDFLFKSTGAKVGMAALALILYSMLITFTAWCIGKDTIDGGNIIFVFADIIVMGLIIFYIFSIGKSINKIKIATDNIAKGNYNNDIEIKNDYVLKNIANNLINIESGLEAAVKKAVKSEKMKGELITNVSHDLRNPLTSIINYVDLLGRVDISKADREKYIEVLKEKSQRLKALIEDLFEASKAASGSMEMKMENIDPVALLRQTIGEFEDKIEASGLQFIKRIPEEKVIVYADGGKTFRVFQNLISNVLKYSMDNSRVYIEVKEEEEFIDVTFRNISKYELNFSEEEILERFKRGDSSRKTEGSGLGLAIAKSLVEIQGGSFKIEIDGDLFKVIVKLKTRN